MCDSAGPEPSALETALGGSAACAVADVEEEDADVMNFIHVRARAARLLGLLDREVKFKNAGPLVHAREERKVAPSPVKSSILPEEWHFCDQSGGYFWCVTGGVCL